MIEVEGDFPPGQRPLLPQPPSRFGDLELRSSDPPRERLDPGTGRTSTRSRWVYQPFLPGEFEFPELVFRTEPVAGSDDPGLALRTEALPVEVMTVIETGEPSQKTVAAATDLERLGDPGKFTDGWRTAAVIGALAVVGGLAFFFWLRGKRRVPAAPPALPREQCLARLQELENEGAANPEALSKLLAEHLESLAARPAKGTPEGDLLVEVESALAEERFSREGAGRDLVQLVRRFLAATPR